ncbi:hypothetical protein FS842_001907 [Serendipita sp. 407]|nr:hypothetical protein FS842_001907 [Serendipita sp. 407]
MEWALETLALALALDDLFVAASEQQAASEPSKVRRPSRPRPIPGELLLLQQDEQSSVVNGSFLD